MSGQRGTRGIHGGQLHVLGVRSIIGPPRCRGEGTSQTERIFIKTQLLPLSLSLSLRRERSATVFPDKLSLSLKSIRLALDCMLNFDCINRINRNETQKEQRGIRLPLSFSSLPADAMLPVLSLSVAEFGGRRGNVFPIAVAITLLNGADMDQSAQTSC